MKALRYPPTESPISRRAELPPIATPAFVGRDRELAELARALAAPPAVVLVEGEAGIGKSRLLDEYLGAGQPRPLVAVCPPYRESLTLGPVLDAIRQARDSVAGLSLTALAGALRPVFPEWASNLPPAPEPLADAGATRHRLFRALAELLDCLAVPALVVEDVHWADQATAEFLLFLVSRRRSPSLVVTYRPEDTPDGSLLLQLRSRVPAGMTRARLSLPPLDRDGTSRMVSSMLGGEPVSTAFVDFLHRSTEGLPLAVEEAVRLLRDRVDLVRRDGEWVRRSLTELQVPPTMRDAVRERVGRLGHRSQLVLRAAAVLTEATEGTVVCRVAGLSGGQYRAGLVDAVGSGLLQEDPNGRLAFRHALMGLAVYEAIPGSERRRLHQRAGQALERTDPPPLIRLARHFREAGQVDAWCRYAERAADLADASGDHQAAAAGLDELVTAVGTSLPGPVRGRLAAKLGAAALRRTEQMDDSCWRRVETLRTVLAAGDLSPAEQAEIRNPLGRLLMQVGEYEAGEAELEWAVGQLSHAPSAQAHAMVALAWPLGSRWPVSVHARWARRAGAVEVRVGSATARLALAADRAAALLLLGEPEGWAIAAGLPTTAASVDGRRQLARAGSNLAVAALAWGDYPEAGRRLATARALAESEGCLAIGIRARAMQAELDWLTGGWDGLAERLAELMGGDVGESASTIHLAAGRLEAAQGSRAKARQYLHRALDHAGIPTQPHERAEVVAALAWLLLAEGRVDRALALTDDPIDVISRKGIWLWAKDIAPVRVEALAAAGRVDEAGQLVGSLARGLRGCRAPGPRAALGLCRAILVQAGGDHDRAAAAFGRAARAWDRLPRPYDALLARERQAGCLLDAHQDGAGLALLSQVCRGMSELGARGDADRIARELRERGVEYRHRPVGRPGYGDRLSPREEEVVRLVVTGRTDRQIAEELFLSPKTVGRHLDSARRKLKVSSRTALAVTAIEAGILAGQPPGARRTVPGVD